MVNVALEVQNLSVTLGKQRVLTDISFTVHRGEVWTILGPNGAGKTVLLRALLGAVPHEGSIRWQEGVRVGYVPQRLPYIKNIPLSVADFFALKRRDPSVTYRASTVRHPPSDVTTLLQDVGLTPDIASRRISDLSSGQFQRTLIAWALAEYPDVLLFDEPTTGIDIGGEETVYALLSRLQRDRHLTMLIITHDVGAVDRLSSMVLCLNRRIVSLGPPSLALTSETLQRLYGPGVSVHEHLQGERR